MTMCKKFVLFLFLSIFTAGSFASQSVLSQIEKITDPVRKAHEITMEDERRDNGFGDLTANITMTLKDKNGRESQRTLRVKTLEVDGDGDKTIMTFDTPRDVRGTAMLTYSHKTGSDDQWIYLPAIKRVKRISSANKTGSFLGSEFTYEDLASPEPEKFTYKYLRDENYNGMDCFVIERYPVDKNSGYSKHVKWIDKEEFRPIRIDYYDRKGKQFKTMDLKGYKKYIGRIWRSSEMVMVNHSTKKATILNWDDYRFKNGLQDSEFSQTGIKRTR